MSRVGIAVGSAVAQLADGLAQFQRRLCIGVMRRLLVLCAVRTHFACAIDTVDVVTFSDTELRVLCP